MKLIERLGAAHLAPHRIAVGLAPPLTPAFCHSSGRDLLLVAGVGTLLLWFGTPVSTPASHLTPLAGLWAVAGGLAVWSRRHTRCALDPPPAGRGVVDSLETLQEVRYALDQAAIVATTDQCGTITSVNDRFCAISGYSREELVGQNHSIINSGYHPPAFFADLWRTIERGSVWRGELRNRAKDGAVYWVDTTIVPFLDHGGRPRQYLAIHNDITVRKDAEAQLRSQAALAHLGQLAAVIAHEVRNPLAGLRASLQVLDARDTNEPSARPVIGAMIQRIDELNEKLGDLLLYARPRPARLQAVDVRSIARDAAAAARAAMGETHPPVPVHGQRAVARADPDMLRAAVLNLTLNACQAAARAGVELQVEGDERVCRICVRDRGPGIPADLRDRLFEPFFTTRPGGTGLGLVVTRRLLDLQGGAVALNDHPEGGTVAEVTLPAAPA